MSKKMVALAAAPKQVTVPLADVTITWPAPNDFEGEDETPTRISGEKLGQIIAWLAAAAPGRLTLPDTPDTWDHTDVRLSLRGLAEVLRALAATNHGEMNTAPILALLADVATDLTGQLAAIDDLERGMKGATVAIAPKSIAPKVVA